MFGKKTLPFLCWEVHIITEWGAVPGAPFKDTIVVLLVFKILALL